MTTHATSEARDERLIHLSTADLVESAAVAARFLDSHGITGHSIRVTSCGRVEVQVKRSDFLVAANAAIREWGGAHTSEPGGVFVDARIDGVPVQVWAGA